MTDIDPSRPKSLLDTMRRILGRGLRPAEVRTLDAPTDGAGSGAIEGGDFSPHNTVPTVSTVPHIRRTERKSNDGTRRVSEAGIALIKRFEGCARLRTDGMIAAYPDPGTGSEPWTIGWGATGRGFGGEGRIGPDTVWTQDQCDARLAEDLERYAAAVARAIGETPTSQNQFDAMVSFHYNTGAIARATLTRKHIAHDYEGAAQEFARWNKAGGRVLKGLVRRRAAESALYRNSAGQRAGARPRGT